MTHQGEGGVPPVDVPLLVAAYVGQLSALLFLLALHRLGDRPPMGSLGSLTRLALFGSAVLGACALSVVLWRLIHRSRWKRRSQLFTVMASVVSIVLVLVTGELIIRLSSVRHGDLVVSLGTELYPRRWQEVLRHYGAVIARMTNEDAGSYSSYLAYDDLLGWSPVPGRTSENGLYHTSAEGIRSPSPGASMLQPASHRTDTTPPYRIALIGDSYTFGAEVVYEETWGHQLERVLGPGVRVRNFGVPGFGVDQAVLRYERDVRPWQPQIVILAPIDDDFRRTMAVYMFVGFPRWKSPFSKPRFTFRDGSLVLVNRPTVHPRTIFAAENVTALPLLDLDGGFAPEEWRFRFYHHSRLIRFVGSRYPPWRTAADSSDDMNIAALNRAILNRFVDETRADGTLPILAYLPSTYRLRRPASEPDAYQELIRAVAARTGVPYTSLAEPLRRARLGTAAATEHEHYTAEANTVVARHFATLVSRALGTAESAR